MGVGCETSGTFKFLVLHKCVYLGVSGNMFL